MMLSRLLSISIMLALSSAAVAAVDLTNIERRIAREPSYRAKPKYCLLVFGPEAEMRVWLVQDGATLYVDRNGNGDLTEAEEKVAAEKSADAEEGVYTFNIGNIRDGRRLHKEMRVYVSKIDHLVDKEDYVKALLAKNPTARGYRILVEVEMPDRQEAASGGRVQQRTSTTDVNGVLQFGERPQDAPILHFGGPWQVTLFGAHQLTIDRDTGVVLGVGSPGIGPGSTTWIDYENVIPTDKYPTLDVVYPPKRPGDAPLREHYELKFRHGGCNLRGSVWVPRTVGTGNAKVTIAFDSWKDGTVASTRHEIPIVAPRSWNLKLEAVSPRLKSELIHPNKTATIVHVEFSPDSKRILAADFPGGVVALWDVASGKRLTTIETNFPTFAVSPDWRTLFAPHLETRKYERVEQDGKGMIRWTFDGDIRAWGLDDGKLLRTYKHRPPRGVCSIQLSPDGKKFVTSENLSGTYEQTYTSTTSLWDVKSGDYRTLDGRQTPGPFSPDGRSFASILLREKENYAQARKLIDVATGEEKWSIPIAEKSALVDVAAFSRDGRILFGSVRIFDRPNKHDSWREWMKWWDAATGREIASFEGEKKGMFLGFRLSPDGQTLAVLNWKGDNRKLFLYSIAEKRLLRTVLLGEKAEGLKIIASGLTFHPRGKWLAVITRRYPVKVTGSFLDPRDAPQPRILLIETATGEIRETMIAPQSFSADVACFSPDGRTLATGGHGRVLLWDMTKMPQ